MQIIINKPSVQNSSVTVLGPWVPPSVQKSSDTRRTSRPSHELDRGRGRGYNYLMTSTALTNLTTRPNQQLSRAARKTLALQIAARRDEIQTCRTNAQITAVATEIARLEGILAAGRWA